MQCFRLLCAKKALDGTATATAAGKITARAGARHISNTNRAALKWLNPEVPLSQIMGRPSSRSQTAMCTSEMESQISRIQGLVQTIKAMTNRIEKHVEERDDGRRLSGPLYRRRMTVSKNTRTTTTTAPLGGCPAENVRGSNSSSEELPDKLRIVNSELMEACERLRKVDGKIEVYGRARQKLVYLDAL